METAPPVFTLPILLLAVSAPLSAAGTGEICLAPIPESVEVLDHDMPGGIPQKRTHKYEFTVQIDEGDRIELPETKPPLLIRGLDPRKRHLIIIRDAGEAIESFWFTFHSRGSNRLCLSYTGWYQTWQLDPPRPGATWCQCESK